MTKVYLQEDNIHKNIFRLFIMVKGKSKFSPVFKSDSVREALDILEKEIK